MPILDLPQTTSQGCSSLANYACARCWKQKKKCDKALPECGRCRMQAATCSYSPQPPKESIFALEKVKEQQLCNSSNYVTSISENDSRLTIDSSTTEFHSASQSFEPKVQYAHSLKCHSSQPQPSISSQVNAIFTAHGIDIENTCRIYFSTFQRWVPFISETEFWREFFSLRNSMDPQFSVLLMAIHIITHVPNQAHSNIKAMHLKYSTTKAWWLSLENGRNPSKLLIQAGLLLATYESGQALDSVTNSTLRTCANMGYELGLYASVRKDDPTDLNELIELQNQRRLWWAIVIFERSETEFNLLAQTISTDVLKLARLLNLGISQDCFSFASQHPNSGDFLPSNYDTAAPCIADTNNSVVAIEYSSGTPYITFNTVAAYPALAQAVYLFSLVEEHNKAADAGSEEKKHKTTLLDETLQCFARSLLQQDNGSVLNGNSCTAFLLAIIALVALHDHNLVQAGPVKGSGWRTFPPRALLAIQALARMFQETAKSLPVNDDQILQMPPFESYFFYIGIVLFVEGIEASNSEPSTKELRPTLSFLRVLQKKWEIAGVYLRAVSADTY